MRNITPLKSLEGLGREISTEKFIRQLRFEYNVIESQSVDVSRTIPHSRLCLEYIVNGKTPNNALPDPGIEPQISLSRDAFAPTEPTRQYVFN